MKKCLIIIPIYKTDLYDYEIMSLKQILSFYQNKYDDIDIALSHPNNLNMNELEKYNIDLTGILYFKHNPAWFDSTETYSQLCLLCEFYELWIEYYEYMLIYQLDAFIFKDELHYWCNKGYDYIGGFAATDVHNSFLLNGGLSLRKISKFVEVLKSDISIPHYSEDQVFTYILYPDGNATIFVDSLYFSIDVSGRIYIPLCNMIYPNLPFGMHAFQKSQYTLNLCKENINYQN